MTKYRYIILCMLTLFVSTGQAETNYIIDELRVGLHRDSTTDSPIVKVVPSGTALEVLSRQGELVRVREPEGKEGWVHQRYLLDTAPDNTRLLELQKRNTALEKQLQEQAPATVSADNNKELEQQLKSERLKVGELQAQLAEVKARLGKDSNAELTDELERLRQANNELVSQLAMAGVDMPQTSTSYIITANNWKLIAVSLGCLFILGVASGAFLLDYLNRRRHGGFRV